MSGLRKVSLLGASADLITYGHHSWQVIFVPDTQIAAGVKPVVAFAGLTGVPLQFYGWLKRKNKLPVGGVTVMLFVPLAVVME